MSINKLISIHNPIIDAMAQLGIDHDKDLPYFTQLATDAEKQIGSANQYERTRTVLDITGCTACLPADSVLVEIAIMGNAGSGCDNLFATICGNDNIGVQVSQNPNQTNFLVVDVGDVNAPVFPYSYVNYNIQNNKIIFDHDYTDQQVTVQYLRFKTDCNGFMEINENHVNAIKWYIVFNYMFRRQGRRSGTYIDRDLMQLAFQEWNRECAHSRAEDNRSTYSQQENMARMYNNPFSGRGLWQGMETTLGSGYYIW